MEKQKNVTRQQSDVIDISGLLRSYLSKWYLFVISVFFCCLLAYVWSQKHPPKYEVTANLLIDTGEGDPMSALSLGGLFGATNYVDDEIFILSSHSLYVNVARELGLDRTRIFRTGLLTGEIVYEDYPLDIVPPALFADTAHVAVTVKLKVNDKGLATGKVLGLKKRVLTKFKDQPLPLKLDTEYGTFNVIPTKDYVPGESYKGALISKGYDSAAEDLDENVDSYIANKKTHVIRIQYPTPYTDFGKKLLNTIMAKYDERVLADKSLQASKTLKFLDTRIDQLGRELATLESGLQDYKETNRIVDLEADAQYNFAVKGELAKQLLDAESQLELTRMASEFIATPGNEYAMIPFPATPGSSENGVQSSVGNYNYLAMERLKLTSSAKPDNFQVKNLEKQLDAMRGNLEATLRKSYDNARVVVGELRSKLNSTQSSLNAFPEQERRIYDITREKYLKQKLYLFLMEKREENAVMIANVVSKGVVVDAAFVPSEPCTMGFKKMLALAFLVGMFLPIIFLFIRKIVRGKPETRAEIENQLNVPILGEVSTSRSGKELVVSAGSTSSAVELFKLLRANLYFMLRGDNGKVVMVTSSSSGEGKSFISINLAASLALQKKKVLLVGLDIRKPMLATYLELPPDFPGITSYLSDTSVSVASITQHVKQVEGLDVIVAGVVPPNPAEMLMEPHLADFFKEVREKYDNVILDCAPVGMVSDSLSVSEYADATIYVTRIGATTFRDLSFINTLYEEERLPSMSVIVNGTRATQGYGYGYGSVEDHGKNVHNTRRGLFSRLFGKK